MRNFEPTPDPTDPMLAAPDCPEEPTFASPDAPAEPTAPQLEAALRKGPVFLADFWDAEIEEVVPELLEIDGAPALLYVGESHALIGEPGKGKSLIAQLVHVREAQAGRVSLYIDLEKNFPKFLDRMRALGLTKEEARHVAYVRPSHGLRPEAMDVLLRFVAEWGVTVVTVDSVGRAMSRVALNENDNNDAQFWYDRVVEPFLQAGATVVLIDHTRKPDPAGGPQARGLGRYGVGAGAKLRVITGAAYMLETVRPFSRKTAGAMKALVAKDNNGCRDEGEVAFVADVAPCPDGSISIELRAPAPTHDEDGRWWPTFYMGKVLRMLGDEWVSTSAVRREVGGGKSKGAGKQPPSDVALERLEEVGLVETRPGSRNANAREWRRTEKLAPASFDGWEAGPPDGWEAEAEEAF